VVEWAGTCCPSKCHLLWGILDPHLVHGSLDPPESTQPTNCISFSSAIFVQFTHAKTDKRTDHATCDICSSRLHLCICVQVMRSDNDDDGGGGDDDSDDDVCLFHC